MSAAEKAETFLAAVDHVVFVHLDGRHAGVEMPENLKAQRNVLLQFSRRDGFATRDLIVDADGVRATLSFNRRPFRVVVPWSAVFGITDGRGRVHVYEAEFPADALGSARPTAPAPRGKPQLRLLKN